MRQGQCAMRILVAQLGEFKSMNALRRNRRQYEQLTDFDRGRIIGLREAGWSNRRIGRHLGRSDMVVARCWQQWITEGRVYRRGGSDVQGTQMIARIMQSEEWPLRHQQRR
ncbi:HTH_38 domain-containing protein [Trichonephila clavipes]|nr:HTH_38 domain-containing protein [Trichonephila clavipes]